MTLFSKLLRLILVGFFGTFTLATATVLGTYIYFAPGLPDATTLKDIELQVPLKVYSRDGKLIAIYGEKRRQPLAIEDFPKSVIQAFLAAEDDRFFEHPGVDYQGLIRAAIGMLLTGEKRQGGSTITMQLARNFFLGRERTYARKIREIFLALKIEQKLDKDEILELYLNKIYLGNRAYGVGAAADVYYGVDVDELNLAQIAMIAGLPKAPSRYNPIANAERAILRRNYVFGRMRELKFIDEKSYQHLIATPITATRHYPRVEVNAPYIGEMTRAYMVDIYGTEAYSRGYRVFTTIDAGLQQLAKQALVNGLLAYDRRHGYREPESHVELVYTGAHEVDVESLDAALGSLRELSGLVPAVVTKVDRHNVEIYLGGQQTANLSIDDAKWARPYINENIVGKVPEDYTHMLTPGDIIRVVKGESGQWSLGQVPNVTGALVAIDPQNGSILSLVGGYDYNYSKFNRATQAKRQPGSSFKPFIYSAALDSGYTPASMVNDAPVVFDVSLEDAWRPQNYSGRFFGPTRLREALIKSRNMVSIRLLKDMGYRYTAQHITKFGFDNEQLPDDLTLALGSGVVSPLELATGYAVFANGGYYVDPYVIERIEDVKGNVLYRSNPPTVCEEDCQALQRQMETDSYEDTGMTPGINVASRVLSKENAYQMVSMMQDVIKRGTGVKARVIGRDDLAGKTGTTNDQRDAWFSGFNGDMVATTWVGFDQHKPLGRREVGAVAALPVWIEFMGAALEGKPENSPKRPDGIVTLRIDPDTGVLVDQDGNQGIEEIFREKYVPTLSVDSGYQNSTRHDKEKIGAPEQLF